MPVSARIKGVHVPLDIVNKDGYSLIRHGLANLCRIAMGEDMKHAVTASVYLVEYGERLMAQHTAKQPEPAKAYQQSRQELIQELKGLYAKALGSAGQPLTLEVEAEEPAPLDRSKL